MKRGLALLVGVVVGRTLAPAVPSPEVEARAALRRVADCTDAMVEATAPVMARREALRTQVAEAWETHGATLPPVVPPGVDAAYDPFFADPALADVADVCARDGVVVVWDCEEFPCLVTVGAHGDDPRALVDAPCLEGVPVRWYAGEARDGGAMSILRLAPHGWPDEATMAVWQSRKSFRIAQQRAQFRDAWAERSPAGQSSGNDIQRYQGEASPGRTAPR
jgi:hypothetical protein